MPTPVTMPQMGESIAEGTIVRWIKRVGDAVDRDEPLFEISTDKVDAEIPAPVAGILTEVRVREGETVPIDTVVALIDETGDAVQAAGGAGAAEAPVAGAPSAGAAPAPITRGAAAVERLPAGQAALAGASAHLSPVVRRLVHEHGVDLAQVKGTGAGGRVSKQDVLAHVASRAQPVPALPPIAPGDGVEIVPMSVMRRQIAARMLASRRTAAHVHTVFEVDFARVAGLRDAHKAAFARAGVKLTYLPFIARAVADALTAMPAINAALHDDQIVYRRDVNLGIAVALDWGLIVPVVKRAHERDVRDLARAIADLAERARARQLSVDDVQGGTFTITNPGLSGAVLGTPIINQPQVAILAVGAVEKRPVVVDDVVVVRPMAYLTLGFDHRLIDGAVADQFLARVKAGLEQFPPIADGD